SLLMHTSRSTPPPIARALYTSPIAPPPRRRTSSYLTRACVSTGGASPGSLGSISLTPSRSAPASPRLRRLPAPVPAAYLAGARCCAMTTDRRSPPSGLDPAPVGHGRATSPPAPPYAPLTRDVAARGARIRFVEAGSGAPLLLVHDYLAG